MKIGRFILSSVVFLLLASATGAFFSYRYLEKWGEEAIVINEEADVRVPRGVSLKQLSKIFAENHLVSNALFFEAWVRIFSDFRQFQAGRYLFHGSLSPKKITRTVIQGEIYQPVVYSVTIPEGFTVHQVESRLIADGITTAEDFAKIKNNKHLLKVLNVPSQNFEGYLYPATYNFIVRPGAKEVVKLMVETFWKELPPDYQEHLKSKGLSLHEAVIIASLIERETGRDDERSAVSEVIQQRLNKGVALAIDASIIYGIEDFDGNLKRKHLKDNTNPYNTRVHAGLPPSPICSPSRASLEAVLTPTNEGYFYYVVKDIKTRQHHFSKTLKEHNTYVRKLIRQGG